MGFAGRLLLDPLAGLCCTVPKVVGVLHFVRLFYC